MFLRGGHDKNNNWGSQSFSSVTGAITHSIVLIFMNSTLSR